MYRLALYAEESLCVLAQPWLCRVLHLLAHWCQHMCCSTICFPLCSTSNLNHSHLMCAELIHHVPLLWYCVKVPGIDEVAACNKIRWQHMLHKQSATRSEIYTHHAFRHLNFNFWHYFMLRLGRSYCMSPNPLAKCCAYAAVHWSKIGTEACCQLSN